MTRTPNNDELLMLIEGELPHDRARQVREAIRHDPALAQRVRRMTIDRARLRLAPTPPPPPGLSDRAIAAAAALNRPPNTHRPAFPHRAMATLGATGAIAAAAALVVVLDRAGAPPRPADGPPLAEASERPELPSPLAAAAQGTSAEPPMTADGAPAAPASSPANPADAEPPQATAVAETAGPPLPIDDADAPDWELAASWLREGRLGIRVAVNAAPIAPNGAADLNWSPERLAWLLGTAMAATDSPPLEDRFSSVQTEPIDELNVRVVYEIAAASDLSRELRDLARTIASGTGGSVTLVELPPNEAAHRRERPSSSAAHALWWTMPPETWSEHAEASLVVRFDPADRPTP